MKTAMAWMVTITAWIVLGFMIGAEIAMAL